MGRCRQASGASVSTSRLSSLGGRGVRPLAVLEATAGSEIGTRTGYRDTVLSFDEDRIVDANVVGPDDDEMTIDIDQKGNATAGTGLKIWLIGEVT